MDAQVSGRTAKPMGCGACAFTCCFCALRRLRLGIWNIFMLFQNIPPPSTGFSLRLQDSFHLPI